MYTPPAIRALLATCTIACGGAPSTSSEDPPPVRSAEPESAEPDPQPPPSDEPDPRSPRDAPAHDSPAGGEPSHTLPPKRIDPDFQAHRTERTDAFELRWSVRAVTEDELRLRYEIKAKEEIYVSDRLWDYTSKVELDAKSRERPDPLGRLGPGPTPRRALRRISDPFGIYRFVSGDTLRLVFEQAPSPPRVQVREVYAPLYSRIAAGETHRREVSIALPVQEYSALARNVDASTIRGTATRVELVFAYRLRSTMDAPPRPHLHEDPGQAGYIVYGATPFVSAIEDLAIPVARREDPIARYELPPE